MTITKAQAGREIKRRKGEFGQITLPDGTVRTMTVHEARAKAVREGTFGLLKPQLREIAGRAKAQAAQARKAPAPKATPVAEKCPLKVGAQEAFQAAFDAAPEGSKRRAGGRAYREFIEGVHAAAAGL